MSKHFKHFKHLHVPDHWQQYWSKYPNGYTLLEALINWVSQVNDMVNQVNENNVHVTTLDRNFRALDKELRASWEAYKNHTETTYTDFREEILTIINNWIASIEPTIQDVVVSSLTQWLNDGTLADIINEDVFDMKADKDYVDGELNTVSEQFAEQDQRFNSLYNANADIPIYLKNYLGNTQNIHPKVLYFENRWNGYNYWMAYTPYPDANAEHENPCIAVTNYPPNWVTPSGLNNPLATGTDVIYNSDTHLVYREDLDVLEIWYRRVNTNTRINTIIRRTSPNGVDWSPEGELISADMDTDLLLSPSIIYEDGIYKMWTINNGLVEYRESTPTFSWSTKTVVGIDWGNLTPWHLDVISTGKGLEFVVSAYGPGGSPNTCDLYYVLQDGNEISKPTMVLGRNGNPTSIDHHGIYRASLLKVNDNYHLYYSSIGYDYKRNMAMAIGSNIKALNGIKQTQDRTEYRTTSLNNVTVEDFDVELIDTIVVYGDVTIKSFINGRRGKKINIILGANSATCTLEYSSDRLILPSSQDFVIDVNNIGLTLICDNVNGLIFRGFGAKPSGGNTIKSLSGGETLSDYDLTDVSTVFIGGSTPATINSLSGGTRGQKVSFVVASINASIIFNYTTSRLYPPNNEDFTFDRTINIVTAVCTDPSNQRWRVG